MTLDTLRTWTPAQALAHAGAKPSKRRGRWTPCPLCGGADVQIGERVWTCYHCGKSLDAVGTGRALSDGTIAGALAWAGLTDDGPSNAPARFAPIETPASEYPPGADALWAACGPVTASGSVSAWLESRGVDPHVVAALDVARALPRRGLPEWARAWAGGWWCVLPVWDAVGRIVSLRARWVRGGDVRAKTRPPTGFSVSGTVLAGPSVPPLEGRVLVVEGEPAYLHAVTHTRGVQVVGVYAGCGGAAHWRRVTEARVATDADVPGDAYAEKIAGWCPTVRMRPPEGMGWDDGWLAGWRGEG